MSFNKFKSAFVALSMVAAAAFAPSANASLIGETVNASGLFISPGSATIGNGVEFHGIFGYVNFDFGANTLTLSPTTGVGWGGFGTYTFSGFTDPITSFTLASNTGFNGNETTNYSFTAHSISIDMNSGSAAQGSQLVFDINAAAVPEPETLALFGIGLLGFAMARRNKRA